MDKYKLEYEMKSKGISVPELCKKIGMSKSTYYRKFSGKSEFTLSEIESIVDVVGLGSPVGIFFDEKVS